LNPARTRADGLSNLGDEPMAKNFRSVKELSNMIIFSVGARETKIHICRDYARGWQPTVVACPGDLLGYQKRVDDHGDTEIRPDTGVLLAASPAREVRFDIR
jgi:hypothetical protein